LIRYPDFMIGASSFNKSGVDLELIFFFLFFVCQGEAAYALRCVVTLGQRGKQTQRSLLSRVADRSILKRRFQCGDFGAV
jgi:hypothetical protein